MRYINMCLAVPRSHGEAELLRHVFFGAGLAEIQAQVLAAAGLRDELAPQTRVLFCFFKDKQERPQGRFCHFQNQCQ